MFIALLLVISPGPNGLLIAKTVPTVGKSAGVANVIGFLGAFYVHGTLSVLGISVLLSQSADAFLVIKIIGALYLAWIGVKFLLAACKKASEKTIAKQIKANKNSSFLKHFLEGFLTNALNPKVSMFYLAAFPQFIPVGDQAIVYAFLLVSLHALINIFWFGAMILLLSQLTKSTQNQFFQRVLNSVTGVVFIGFGAKLLTLEAK
jgi:threonine/homoserine/homoserine lactone efflux protein